MGELHCHWFGRQTVAAIYRTAASPVTPAPAAPTIAAPAAAPAATGPASVQLTDMMSQLAATKSASYSAR